MTSDMAFECLFISRDAGLFRTLNRILRDLSISTNICLSSSKAFDLLDRGSTDLIVIDWQDEESSDLMDRIWKGGKWRKPTVMAVSASHSWLPGVHIVLRKPVTTESGQKGLKDAYSKMVVDYRKHVRHALMQRVVVTLDEGRTAAVVICDIGDGGIGISSKHAFVIGDVLSFRLTLPGQSRDILVYARILWTRDYGRAGCEFVRIPPVDRMILHQWLKDKTRIKKPLATV